MEPNKNRSATDNDDYDERKMAWSKGLHSQYDGVAHEPLPDRFRELLERLQDAESRGR